MKLAILGVLLGVALSACTSQPEATWSKRANEAIRTLKTQNPAQMDSIVVRLNQTERVMVDENTVSLDSLEWALEKARGKKGVQTKFVFAVSTKAKYAVFIQAQGAIESQVYKERNRLAQQMFEKHYEKLTSKEKSELHQNIPLLIEERILK